MKWCKENNRFLRKKRDVQEQELMAETKIIPHANPFNHSRNIMPIKIWSFVNNIPDRMWNIKKDAIKKTT
jgi:hypothetical protein